MRIPTEGEWQSSWGKAFSALKPPSRRSRDSRRRGTGSRGREFRESQWVRRKLEPFSRNWFIFLENAFLPDSLPAPTPHPPPNSPDASWLTNDEPVALNLQTGPRKIISRTMTRSDFPVRPTFRRLFPGITVPPSHRIFLPLCVRVSLYVFCACALALDCQKQNAWK